MRMKFNKSSQLLLVSAASLLVAGLVTACGTLTVDFVFVSSAKAAGSNNAGEIDVLEIDSESGYMRQIPTSPFPSGGRNPVAEAASSDNTNLFVVNQDDNSIVQFIIGNDGKLYPQNTVNTPGIYPEAVTVNGSNLFVVDTYQPLPTCSTAEPCSGSIAVFPITASSSNPPSDVLGSAVANGSINYWPLSIPGKPNDVVEPTAINVLANGSYAYVAAYDVTASANYIFGYSIASGGAFAQGICNNAFLNGPFEIGTCPSAVASDSTGSFLYVTDATAGKVHAYAIASGLLTEISGSPFAAGNAPSAIVVDPKYPFVYVTNALDSTVSAYSSSNGVLTNLGTYATSTEPVAVGIDPSTNHFLFTANYLYNGVSGTVSGFELNPTSGVLVNSQNTPFTINAYPTAVAAIPHGVTTSSK